MRKRTPAPDKPRVGILVVAYNAVSTLADVLERIPPSLSDVIDVVLAWRRLLERQHLRGRSRIPTHTRLVSDRRRQATPEPRLRRQSEIRLSVVRATRRRPRRAPPRRRSVRTRGAAGDDRSAPGGARRRRPWIADARRGRRPPGWDAAVQVHRQQDPDQVSKQGLRARALRMALRVSRIQRRRVGKDPVRGEQRLVRFRHRGAAAALRLRCPNRRGADPDLLRGRDLQRERSRLRKRRLPRRCPLSARTPRVRLLSSRGLAGRVRLERRPRRKPSRRALAGRRARPGAGTRSRSRLRRRSAQQGAARPRPLRGRGRREPAAGDRRQPRSARRRRPRCPPPARGHCGGPVRHRPRDRRPGAPPGPIATPSRAPRDLFARCGLDLERAQHRTLVPATADRARPLRLRPPGHPRCNPHALLHLA